MLKKYSTFLFDLDGTLYRGDKIIPHAVETINKLTEMNKDLLFISNKTTGKVDDYFELLKKGNANIRLDQFLNSTMVLVDYLAEQKECIKFYAIGEDVFINSLQEAGHKYTTDIEEIEFVIITLDRTFNFEKLEIAAKALEKGARFIAANIDDTCPVEGGEIIDAGSVISALEKRTHSKLEKHFGKPSQFMMMAIEKRIPIDKSKTIIVGDRLETDIALGNNFGIDSALVDSGIINYPNGNGSITPTYHLETIYDLISRRLS